MSGPDRHPVHVDESWGALRSSQHFERATKPTSRRRVGRDRLRVLARNCFVRGDGAPGPGGEEVELGRNSESRD